MATKIGRAAPVIAPSANVITGLRLVVERRSQGIQSALHVPEHVLKADVYQWRKSHDLAAHAEEHAQRILAAVEAFRSADLELTLAEKAAEP